MWCTADLSALSDAPRQLKSILWAERHLEELAAVSRQSLGVAP